MDIFKLLARQIDKQTNEQIDRGIEGHAILKGMFLNSQSLFHLRDLSRI